MRRLKAAVMLGLIFPRELWNSSLSVVLAALSVRPRTSPCIMAMPLEVKSDNAIVALANLITLTPGTTTLHVSDDRSTLYFHCLQGSEGAQVVRQIKLSFERWLLELEA